MKQKTIQTKIKKIESALDRIENGLNAGVRIEWIADQIAWLWKFRFIDYKKMSELTDRMIYIFDNHLFE